MRCKTFSPELTAAKSWQKSNGAKKSQKSFTWDTHRLHEVSSVLYNPARLKGFPNFPSPPSLYFPDSHLLGTEGHLRGLTFKSHQEFRLNQL